MIGPFWSQVLGYMEISASQVWASLIRAANVPENHLHTRLPPVNWTEALFDVIDMRSFSNLWYWIGIAVLWSSMSHWVLGVPFDLIQRARKNGGDAEQDLIDIVRVNVNRLLGIARFSGPWLLMFVSFANTALLVLAFFYWIEFAQALLFIVFPLSIVGIVSLSSAQHIETNATDPQSLYKMLLRHRLWTQIIGMVSIFITSMYGMYHNLTVPFW
jgi:hypothetical protein